MESRRTSSTAGNLARKNDLLKKLDQIDPQRIVALRYRTQRTDDGFADSFGDWFADSFSDSFTDSFWDSFSDFATLTPVEAMLQRVRETTPENLVGLDIKTADRP
jgi:hypothetical protein